MTENVAHWNCRQRVTLGVGNLDPLAVECGGVEAIDHFARDLNGSVARLFQRRELISVRIDVAVLPVTDIEEKLWHGRSLSPDHFQTIKRCDWFRNPLQGSPAT